MRRLLSIAKTTMHPAYTSSALQKQLTFPPRLDDTITRTEFGRAAIWKSQVGAQAAVAARHVRNASSRKDTERAAGCEMALDIKSVLDSGVNGQEALG